jgi:hypothetical protein
MDGTEKINFNHEVYLNYKLPNETLVLKFVPQRNIALSTGWYSNI